MATPAEKNDIVAVAVEVATKLGLLFLFLYISFLIVKPFLGMLIWAAIIAVALFPTVRRLEQRLGGRRKTVVVAFTVIIVAALAIPTYMLSDTMIASGEKLAHTLQEGTLTIPPPTEKVKSWPLIGEKAYRLWHDASENLAQTLAPFKEDIRQAAGKVFGALGNGLKTVLMFIASTVIAAFFLIDAERAADFYRLVMRRLLGERGDEWANLSTLTVRSVVTGVIGVAVIQALLALAGLLAMQIPFAVVWALAIMFLTVIQLPALLVIGPVIAWVFSQGSGTAEILFAVYMLIVGASDGVLKPLLMGRGVDIPMLVILIGAIGGMMLLGMIGLFIGAVVFSLTYKLFQLWIDEVEIEAADTRR